LLKDSKKFFSVKPISREKLLLVEIDRVLLLELRFFFRIFVSQREKTKFASGKMFENFKSKLDEISERFETLRRFL
jgi:hypothetical protein